MDSGHLRADARLIPGREPMVRTGLRRRFGLSLLMAVALVGTALPSGAGASGGSSAPAGVASYYSCGDEASVPLKYSGRVYASGKGYCSDTRGDNIPRIKLTVYLQRYSSSYGWQPKAKKVKDYYDVPSGSDYEQGPVKPYISCGYPYTSQKFRTRVKVEAYSGSSGSWNWETRYTKNSSSGYRIC